jgi:hypothetical protein
LWAFLLGLALIVFLSPLRTNFKTIRFKKIKIIPCFKKKIKNTYITLATICNGGQDLSAKKKFQTTPLSPGLAATCNGG